jgi:hypothetical protein
LNSWIKEELDNQFDADLVELQPPTPKSPPEKRPCGSSFFNFVDEMTKTSDQGFLITVGFFSKYIYK